MSIFGIKYKNQIFIRLLVVFLIVIMPIYIISINIYNIAMAELQEQITNSMTAQIEFYLNGLDSEIQRIKLLQYDCVNDDSLNRLTYSPEILDDYEKSRDIRSLMQHLFIIKNSSSYIKDVIAEILPLDTSISAVNGVNKISDIDLPQRATPVNTIPGSLLSYSGDEFYLDLVFPFSNIEQKDIRRSFLLRVTLSNDTLQKALAQFNTNIESFTIMLNSSSGSFFAAGYDTDSDKNIQLVLTDNSRGMKAGTYTTAINKKTYHVVFSTSEYLGMTLARYIPEDILYNKLRNYQIWFWILSGMSLIIIVLYSMYTYRFIHKPLSKLVNAFKAVEYGDLKINIEHKHNDEFHYLYKRFDTMVSNLDVLIEQVYMQKILVQHAELKQLQSQINPHFLYNTFFTLYSMAKAEDYENVVYFLEQFGNYFQFITRNMADNVSLCREVEHARTYTDIQVMRFPNRICAEFSELPEEFREIMVPRLILQPIIENSFEHGLEDKVSNGIINIYFQKDEDKLVIVVEDNGDSLVDDELDKMNAMLSDSYIGETTAIVNIHRRVRLKYGTRSGLTLYKGDLGGLKVCININLSEDKNV